MTNDYRVLEMIADAKGETGPWGNIAYINPRVFVTAVYDGPHEATDPEESEKTETFTLFPGQVQIDTGDSLKEAWVVMPYGMRVDMVKDQKGSTRVERTGNQHFGTYSMPRVGDTVFVIGFDFGHGIMQEIKYFVFGVMGSDSTTQPPPVDKEDVQIVHRSGSSIRLNDTYAGGGGITTTTVSAMKDLTGNLTMVGNRTMLLAGRKYLSHGQLAKYGDIREPFSGLKVQTFTEDVEDGLYGSLFANTSTETYYDPFAEENIANGDKFLSPPSTTDSIIPLSDNTLLLAQHGGGVVRIDDHNSDSTFSRVTMASASMSFMVGEEYQDLGRAGDSATVGDAAGIGGDGNAGLAGDVGTGTDTFELQHSSGTRVTIDDDGTVNIFTNSDDATIHIDTQDSAKIYIGEGEHPAIRSEDTTQSAKATTAIAGPPDTHLGFLGIPHAHMHNGHVHTELHTQEKLWV